MAFMYIPPPYSEERYDGKFMIIHDGRFYICKRYWSAQRTHKGHFVVSIQKRCTQFVITMTLNVFDVHDCEQRLVCYNTDVGTRREYRYMLIYLRFYCNKLKHRSYYEVKDVIVKHFLRLGIYLSPSVFQLIIFFHSLRTTLYDHEIKDNNAQAMSYCRMRLLTS